MSKRHIVADGDSLIALATEAGFASVDAIWKHAENAKLREARKDPRVLLPGDEVFIPDPQPASKQVPCGSRHTFVLRTPAARVRARILDHDAAPAAQCRYALDVAGEHFEGTTDAGGIVDQRVPASAKSATLTVWMEENDAEVARKWELDLGHLEPLREIRGVQTRLCNLGLYGGSEDGALDAVTRAALRTFQQKRGIAVTGEADDATYAALEELYGI
jgi:hypothetical protein